MSMHARTGRRVSGLGRGVWGVRGLAALMAVAGALIASCSKAPAAKDVTVSIAVAASMKTTLEDLVATYRRSHWEFHAESTSGASGTFYQQLTNGAPFDLFLSADTQYPHRLVEAGKAEPQSECVYAEGKLMLWLPKASKLHPEKDGLGVLKDPSVQKVAVANPMTAPYGRAAMAAINSANLGAALKDRLAVGQSVEQAAQYAESGAADAAFLPMSVVNTPALVERGRAWPVPPSAYPPIEHGAVVIKGATEAEGARAFLAFIISDEGRAVIEKHDLGVPDKGAIKPKTNPAPAAASPAAPPAAAAPAAPPVAAGAK